MFHAFYDICMRISIHVYIFLQTGEERDITHMQYCSWPDHGVPSDWRQFTTFTERVRAARTGIVEPAVVHCSAGIGRTGVLVLMETALCLIEANQPVYPLDIVRSMRDQRAMMIQNAVSKSCLLYLYGLILLNLLIYYHIISFRVNIDSCVKQSIKLTAKE